MGSTGDTEFYRADIGFVAMTAFTTVFTEKEFIEFLFLRIASAGGRDAFAKKIDVSSETIRLVETGQREPNGKLLRNMGVRREILYYLDSWDGEYVYKKPV